MMARLVCWFGGHAWTRYPHLRLFRLDESWPPVMADGLSAGTRWDCSRCKARVVR